MIIKQLYVDHEIASHPFVSQIAGNLSLSPKIIYNSGQLFNIQKHNADPCSSGKQILFLTQQKGPFLKKCPGTKEYICCDYKILHIASYCTMDCAYCILQAYFHPPILQYFVNHEALISEVKNALDSKVQIRIGTGEFTDSLIWEMYSDLTTDLIHLFAAQNRSVFELKTKTVNIPFLENLDHQRKTILAWSLNTPTIIATQERGTSSLGARIKAAAQCQKWGYPLAFHFDPIFIYPNYEEEYGEVIQLLFKEIDPENIVWISMGTFRFMPSLKPIIQERFPDSNIVYNEFITGMDGKMRYFKQLRIQAYHNLSQMIKRYAPNVTVYLCMEDDTIWEQGLGFSPQSKGGLPAMLDKSMCRQCGCV